MIQGMTSRILDRVRIAKTDKSYRHLIYRNEAIICSILVARGECWMTVWTFKPVSIRQYLDIDLAMKAFASKHSIRVHYSHANLKFG